MRRGVARRCCARASFLASAILVQMPRVESSVFVPIEPALAFAVSQTFGEVRYRWDGFVRKQYHLDDATHPAKGVQTYTKSRHGVTMVSEYVNFSPPDRVGMKMVSGPWFFEKFGGGWSFAPHEGGTMATWRYTFTIKPAFLAPIANPIGRLILGWEIDRRINRYAGGCEDEVVLDAARNSLTAWS